MKKVVAILFAFATLALTGLEAQASKLPDQVWDYVKKEIPSATQRFDSVISVGADVMYVPLYPAQREDVEKLSVEYSYPGSKALRQLPEVIIFNNNYVLLKIFKNKKGEFTITSYDDLPMKVKLGIMPQDMLVPVGLQVPEHLKPILGDLNIPSKNDGAMAVNKDGTTGELTLEGRVDSVGKLQPLKELKNKKLYVAAIGSKFMMVYDNDSKDPLYELKLSALPSNVVVSNSSKFALVSYYAHKNLEVIDLKYERILSQIPIEDVVKDVDIDPSTGLAYVSVPAANSIYVVDLNSAKLAKTIKLTQAPGKMSLCEDGTALAFVDNLTQELCYMDLVDDFIVRPIAQVPNASKIILRGEKIYALSRVKNKLDVYNAFTGVLLGTEKLSQKPVDAYFRNGRIYILCAKDALIDVYDTAKGKVDKTIKLPGDGFYSKISPIPNQQNVLITGANTSKCLVFDLENMKVISGQPFDVKVSNVIVVDK